jgi:hypothetical protein
MLFVLPVVVLDDLDLHIDIFLQIVPQFLALHDPRSFLLLNSLLLLLFLILVNLLLLGDDILVDLVRLSLDR